MLQYNPSFLRKVGLFQYKAHLVKGGDVAVHIQRLIWRNARLLQYNLSFGEMYNAGRE